MSFPKQMVGACLMETNNKSKEAAGANECFDAVRSGSKRKICGFQWKGKRKHMYPCLSGSTCPLLIGSDSAGKTFDGPLSGLAFTSINIHTPVHRHMYEAALVLPLEEEELAWRLFRARRPCKGMSPPSRTLL